MANTNYSTLRGLSMLGGLSLVGVGAFLNVSHAAETEGGYFSPVCIAIWVLAFGSALAVPVMLISWRTGRRGLAVFAFVGLVASESYGFQLSAERLLAARDQRAQSAKLHNAPHELAREALDELRKERKAECASGLGKSCKGLKAWEDEAQAKLASTPAPRSHSLLADATGLPAWFVEIVPSLAFSSGIMVLGFVLVGYGAHAPQGDPGLVPLVAEILEPDGNGRVVPWVREFRRRYGRNPKIPEVQAAFKGLPKTTAWRRIQNS